MADVFTVVAKIRAAKGKGERYKDDAAFDAHRKSPHLAAYRERREKEGLTEGGVEVDFYRSVTD
jgi:quinol monooxygenase YgiN